MRIVAAKGLVGLNFCTHFLSEEIADPPFSCLAAHIEHLEFLGTFIRLRMRVAGLSEALTVDVDARSARQLGLCQGLQLGMHLPAEALSCFAA